MGLTESLYKIDRPFSSSQVDGSSQLEDLLYGEYTFQLTEPNSNCFVPKQRYPRGGLSYSDIHDQEVLDSLSDRP